MATEKIYVFSEADVIALDRWVNGASIPGHATRTIDGFLRSGRPETREVVEVGAEPEKVAEQPQTEAANTDSK